MPYTIRPLGASTWEAFAELVDRNNGVFGGCWCIGFHCETTNEARRLPTIAQPKKTASGRAAPLPPSSLMKMA